MWHTKKTTYNCVSFYLIKLYLYYSCLIKFHRRTLKYILQLISSVLENFITSFSILLTIESTRKLVLDQLCASYLHAPFRREPGGVSIDILIATRRRWVALRCAALPSSPNKQWRLLLLADTLETPGPGLHSWAPSAPHPMQSHSSPPGQEGIPQCII